MAERKIGTNTGNRGLGRPKGAKNKTTVAAKEALSLAAEGIGGTERLIEWVKESPDNERVFWSQMYTKLLPHEVNATVAARVVFETVIEK